MGLGARLWLEETRSLKEDTGGRVNGRKNFTELCQKEGRGTCGVSCIRTCWHVCWKKKCRERGIQTNIAALSLGRAGKKDQPRETTNINPAGKHAYQRRLKIVTGEGELKIGLNSCLFLRGFVSFE